MSTTLIYLFYAFSYSLKIMHFILVILKFEERNLRNYQGMCLKI